MMRSRKHYFHTLTTVLMGALMVIGVGLIGGLFNITRILAQGETATAATLNATSSTVQPSASPFANVLTQLAAPTATNGPAVSATAAKATVTPIPSATGSLLSAADAMATITAQQTQIKSLQDQLSAGQGDKGATLYALVIIVIGLLLAFAVFFGLRRS